MSFTDGKPWIATEADTKAIWSGGKAGAYFRCAFCGHRFAVGDIVRWQYTNDVPNAWGNPLICQKCDGDKEAVIAKWKAMHEEAKNRMWWFARQVI